MKHIAKRKSLLALLFICLCLVLSCAFVVHGNFSIDRSVPAGGKTIA